MPLNAAIETNGARQPPREVPRLSRAACLAIFVFALVVRLAATAVAGFATVRFADAAAYVAGAGSLAQTGDYPLRTDPFLFRPPGYPAFLAVVTGGHPENAAAAKVANGVLGALAAVVLAGLAARVTRRRDVAIFAGVLAALHPTFVLMAIDVQTEPLFLLLFLCSGYLLLAATDRPSSNLAILSGGFLALAALTRSSALPLAALFLAPLADRRYPRRVGLHLSLSALLGFAVILAPWTARNAVVFRELIFVNDGGGYVFYGGNGDATLRLADARSREELEEAVRSIDRALRDRIGSLPPEIRNSPGRLSRSLTAAAISERRADPQGTLRLLAWKTWDWLRPYPDPRYWPAPAVVLVGAYFCALFVLAGVGIATARRKGLRAFCLVLLVLTMALHVALAVSWRYRTVYWDPVLLLYACSGAATLLEATARRSPQPGG